MDVSFSRDYFPTELLGTKVAMVDYEKLRGALIFLQRTLTAEQMAELQARHPFNVYSTDLGTPDNAEPSTTPTATTP